MKNYASQGIGKVLKAEFESMIPHTQQTHFAVDDSDIQVIVRDNRRKNALERIQTGLEDVGKAIGSTAESAIEGVKNIWGFLSGQ